MKRRWAWRWTLTYASVNGIGGFSWHGTCPVWAAQPVPAGATLTADRVLVVGGRRVTCSVPGCKDGSHPVVARA